jgi:hypothetical protein
MCEQPEYVIKYQEKMNGFLAGICLFWLTPPEIHIAENLRNTPSGALILTHEKTHLKFMNLAKKHAKLSVFIILYNDLWDYYDTARILFVTLIAKLRLLR